MPSQLPTRPRLWQIWLCSFAIWMFIGVAAGLSMYQFDRSVGKASSLQQEMILPLIQEAIYGLLTPLVFLGARRWPLLKDNWRRRLPLYALGGLLFAVVHVTLRAIAYPVWDPRTDGFSYAVWNPHTGVFAIQWTLMKRLFLFNLLDDIVAAFTPVVIIAHALLYHQKYKERETIAAQLETQLTKARLQALKSQIHPHFLFNTLNSISALMHTDVRAADRMMSRLSDLLRLSLEDESVQETTLNHELEFINGYLEIEQVRFADRLKVIYDIAPETLDALVPHLLLQPLAENAVRHGISKRALQGEIVIKARFENEHLYLSVRDNGPGLVPSVSNGGRSGLGLRATRDRLRSLYGDDQRFDLHAASGGGAEAEIWIPFRPDTRQLLYGPERALPQPVA